MADIKDVLSRLQSVHGGNGQWYAKCPAHDDQHGSLSVKLGDDGKILLKCHASCNVERIVSAIGLTMADLFPAKKKPEERPHIIATYDYKDAAGQLLAQKLRYSDKHFSWRRPDGKGGWVYNRNGVPHTLYVAGEISKAVFVCEGEKDCDNLHAASGWNVVSGENGASHGKWLKEYSQQLNGCHVVVFCDNDDVGREYAAETCSKLHGIAESVKSVDLAEGWPEMPEKGDVSDAIAILGREATIGIIRDLISKTPEWEPKPEYTRSEKELEVDSAADAENQTLTQFAPTDFSDAGNATKLIEFFDGNVLYCDALKWLYYDGIRWAVDEHSVVKVGISYTDAMLGEAKAMRKDAEAKVKALKADKNSDKKALSREKAHLDYARRYYAHAIRSRYAGRIQAALDLASHSVVIKADQLDADPFILNTPECVVDLRTGERRPHAPSDRELHLTHITRCSPTDGKFTDSTKKWKDFLMRVCCNDIGLANYLMKYSGLFLIGKVYRESMLIANGNGKNGKSTFFNAMLDVLGDYAGTIDVDVLTTDRQNRGAAFASIRGKRLVVSGEMEEGKRMSVSTVKRLVSTDKLTIEEKFKAPETVNQSHTLVLFTNHLPRIGSLDGGTWRRIDIVPFNAKISPAEDILNYASVLADECGPDILDWMILGAKWAIQDKFKLDADTPECVKAATADYRKRENWIEKYLDVRCERGSDLRVGARELYNDFKSWAQETGEHLYRETDFCAAMEMAGFQWIKPKNKKTWLGLDLIVGVPDCGIEAHKTEL